MSSSANLTLSITRIIDAPKSVVWRCWTTPELLKQWHCPKPWSVAEADIDVKAGGRMNIVMAGPNGERIENTGSYLEVAPQTRLVFTDAYSEGFMPRPNSFMTGVVELSDEGENQTKMIWSARHTNEDDVKKHLEMGFEAGWSAAADQLNTLTQSIS